MFTENVYENKLSKAIILYAYRQDTQRNIKRFILREGDGGFLPLTYCCIHVKNY